MSNVGGSTWFTKNSTTQFVVKNISPNRKTIRIFNYPILNGATRDLLSIPSVSEADIRHSLLKGELLVKIKHGELIITDSNIDLLQFDTQQLTFLQNSGVNHGLQVQQVQNIVGKLIQDISLSGTKNGTNLVFTLASDKFIFDSDFKILVYINGIRQAYVENFIVAESGGIGTGYDTVIFTEAPTALDDLFVDYYKA